MIYEQLLTYLLILLITYWLV